MCQCYQQEGISFVKHTLARHCSTKYIPGCCGLQVLGLSEWIKIYVALSSLLSGKTGCNIILWIFLKPCVLHTYTNLFI